MKTEMKIVPCTKCGLKSLLRIEGKGNLTAVWSDCECLNKNQILSQLREEGYDIGNQYFTRKAKTENRPAKNELLLGKFKTEKDLEAALYSLAQRMDVPFSVVDEKKESLGLVTAYQRLMASFSSRKHRKE